MVRAIARMVVAMLLMGLLAACGGEPPPQAIVEQAIALEINQTQQQLQQQLFRGSTEFPAGRVDHVKVKKQQSQTLPSERAASSKLNGYRVEGTYDLIVETPSQRSTRRQNPFEVYLQYDSEGKTWSLAQPLPPDAEGQIFWETRSLDPV